MPADLHIHTTASDGRWQPQDIGRAAKARGLHVIAVTDHDTTAGLDEALSHCPQGLGMIPGVELSTDYRQTEVHILGYWVDVNNKELQTLLQGMRDDRTTRAQAMVERLNQLGMDLSFHDVASQAGPAAIGRAHIASALQEAGYCLTKTEAFERWLSIGKPAYIERDKVTPHDAVKLLRQAHGVPVLAHPGLMDRDELIPELCDCGLQGIEVIHPDHTAKDRQHYWRLAKRLGLAASGGSDCHGPGGKDTVLLGQFYVPTSWVKRLSRCIQVID